MADTKITCSRCGKSKKLADYYSSNSPIHSYHEKIPICKNCLLDIVDPEDVRSVANALRMIDKPFIYELYESSTEEAEKRSSNIFQMYMKNVVMRHHKDKNWNDSEFKPNDILETKKNEFNDVDRGYSPEDIEKVEFTKEEMEFLVDFWGQGYSKDDYEYLQREYEKLTGAYESDSSYAMEIIFQEAAQQRLTIKRKREKGESVDKELKTFQDLLGSANIKPSQETGANSAEQATFGTLIKKWENERPVPEPDEEWKDVDGIRRYVSVWFLGHLCKMLGIKNQYSKMYEEEIAKYTVDSPEGDGED